jgi:xylulokinase
MFFLGLDFGTSSVKALLIDGSQHVVAHAEAGLTVSSSAPDRREQHPKDWWQALLAIMDVLRRDHPGAVSAIEAIGLSGQMHGAVLLDAAGAVLRPCILWNDGRATEECRLLEVRLPDLAAISGNVAMPGFTAPKLLWVQRHEPDIFAHVATVLLPKAWIRYRLTGELIEEMSDASGTLWLDTRKRDWSDAALAATGLDRSAMPRLVEGTAPAGRLRPDLAKRWGIAKPPLLAGGAGDNAAGAIGLSAIRPGDAFISLGSSGVLWVTTGAFQPYPQAAVHAFCHALPGLWHQMGVTLSAAASLAWWARLIGQSESALLEGVRDNVAPGEPLFLPYLAGERTPHNDAVLRGTLAGLSLGTERHHVTQSIMEGVALSLRDCLDAIRDSGTSITEADVIGGGSRSAAWVRMLASALDLPLHRIEGSELAGAYGAARLARIASTGESVAEVCRPRARLETILPDPLLRDAYVHQFGRYRRLGAATRHI